MTSDAPGEKVTEASAASGTRLSTPRTSRPTRRRVLGVGAGVATVVIAVVVAFTVSPWPAVLLFRGLMSFATGPGSAGPYADDVADVRQVAVEKVPVDGLPDATLTIYAPETATDTAPDLPVIVYIHGGGWIGGTAESVSTYARLLSSGGYVVANLEYSLAPEYRYPAPVQQAAAALAYLRERATDYGGDASRLFLAGNSAGAQISSQLGALITDRSLQRETGLIVDVPPASLRGVILLNGVFDFDTAGRAGFPGFTSYVWSYTGQKDYRAYPRIDELSTARNVTPAYPDTFLTAGDGDLLETQTYEFDAILRAAGVTVDSLYWTGSDLGLPHDYMLALDSEAAQDAYEAVSDFLRARSEP